MNNNYVIMDYEKKYEEALERARVWKEKSGMPKNKQGILDDIFPELKESEDERIRKGIIRNLEYLADRAEGFVKDELKEMIAWLEKQGTSYTKRDVDDAYVEGMASAKYELEKQGEQKSINVSIKEKAHQIAWETSKHYDPLLSKECWCEMAALDMASWLKKHGEQKFPIEKLPEEMKSIGESLGFTTQEECDKYNQMVTDIIMSDDDKIEQKPTDEDMKEALRTEYEKGRADAIAEMQKAWSEEDEEELDIAISTLKEAGQHDSAEWLKSLKDRIQPKQEWSEEDEKIINKLIAVVELYYGIGDDLDKQRCLSWLKSFKQRHTWNPSDEQMKALHELNLTGNISYAGQGQTLIELYNDLKKLKGN